MKQLKSWLTAIDQTSLPGTIKTWCYQQGITPRLRWPLALYDFAMSSIKKMQRMSSAYIRKWLGLTRGFSDVNLYSRSSPASLQLSSIEEEFKTSQVRTALLLQDSRDHTVHNTFQATTRKKKWSAQAAIQDAESSLRIAEIVGIKAQGRSGLGSFRTAKWTGANTSSRRHQIIEEVKKQEEEQRQVKAVSLASQGAWTRWEAVEPRKISDADLLTAEEAMLTFFLRASTDTLPSLTNQAIWKQIEDPRCPLCQEGAASLRHVLSSCKKALTEHRYTWHHNQVLQVISKWLEITLEDVCKREPMKKKLFIQFCKEGETSNTRKKELTSILREVQDLTQQNDLKTKLVFPQDICSTNLRPDILVTSRASKTILLIELTVPWEDRIEEAHELKMSKYEAIVTEARNKNWKAQCFAVEVGCRGFPGKSLAWMLRKIGVPSLQRKKAIKEIAEVTVRCSRWIWLQRSSSWLSQ